MIDVNYWAVVVATVVAFVVSSVWYVVFGGLRAKLLGADTAEMTRPVPWKMLVEILRSLVVVAVFAGFAAKLGITALPGALLLAGSLWIAFPTVILSGSVLWENVPMKLAAIHVGDWLVKLLVIAVVIGLWH
ncbi:MAG: hypothetical protein JWQ81_5859 [Amycolatopsis sp.]|uniref:DUF1761 domain-containing protein n=1 Tax=Amycolatopsis sp. TaxID=37632 RepID=UPI0026380C41|nr:DUF1761 domain-containing protein [Amycolatopsis sp.]MCU1685120.1 hypothetical protein [Amycolatopsis sp.]